MHSIPSCLTPPPLFHDRHSHTSAENQFFAEKHSFIVRKDSTLDDPFSDATTDIESDNDDYRIEHWRFHVRKAERALVSIVQRDDAIQRQERSIRSFRERADALSLKLAVFTALAKQAHREAR